MTDNTDDQMTDASVGLFLLEHGAPQQEQVIWNEPGSMTVLVKINFMPDDSLEIDIKADTVPIDDAGIESLAQQFEQLGAATRNWIGKAGDFDVLTPEETN